MFKRECRRRIDPVAANIERQQLAAPLEVDPPGGTPPGLPLYPDHPAAEIPLQPFGDADEFVASLVS